MARRPVSGSYAYSGGGSSARTRARPSCTAWAALACRRAIASCGSELALGVLVTPNITAAGGPSRSVVMRSNSSSPRSNMYFAQRPYAGEG
jgi:hypothetical protein